MICQLCRNDKKLIKAHIIPEGFFRQLRSERRAPEIHTNKEGEYPKRAPIGIYDTGILCAECDNRLAPWDNHAQQVLLQDFSEDLAIYYNQQKIVYRIADFDYKLLKLFFISLLWRASVSTHKFYQRISAGPFEQKLKEMILSEDPGPPLLFAVTLAKFSDPAVTGVLDPHRDKFEGINYCRFYLTGFVAYIKVDRRSVPNFLKDLYLRPDTPIPVILRDFHHSKDGVVMKDILRKSVLKDNT